MCERGMGLTRTFVLCAPAFEGAREGLNSRGGDARGHSVGWGVAALTRIPFFISPAYCVPRMTISLH